MNYDYLFQVRSTKKRYRLFQVLDSLASGIVMNTTIIILLAIPICQMSYWFGGIIINTLFNNLDFNDAPFWVTFFEFYLLDSDREKINNGDIDISFSLFATALIFFISSIMHQSSVMGITMYRLPLIALVLITPIIMLLNYLDIRINSAGIPIVGILLLPHIILLWIEGKITFRRNLAFSVPKLVRIGSLFRVPSKLESAQCLVFSIWFIAATLLLIPSTKFIFFIATEVGIQILDNITPLLMVLHSIGAEYNLINTGQWDSLKIISYALSIVLIILYFVAAFINLLKAHHRKESLKPRIILIILLLPVMWYTPEGTFFLVINSNYEHLHSKFAAILFYSFILLYWLRNIRLAFGRRLSFFFDKVRHLFLKSYEDFQTDLPGDFVLLRAFKDDSLVIQRHNKFFAWILGFPDKHLRLEEIVGQVTVDYGSIVSLANPHIKRQLPGSIKQFVQDDNWQQKALNLMQNAEKIIIILGDTKNLHWELEQIMINKWAHKLVLLIPPKFDKTTSFKALNSTVFKPINFDINLPKENLTTLKIIYFSDRLNHAVGLFDKNHFASSYTRLLHCALTDEVGFTKSKILEPIKNV